MTQDPQSDIPPTLPADAPPASMPDPAASPKVPEPQHGGPTARFRRRGAPVWILALVCVNLGLAASWIGQQRKQINHLENQLQTQDIQLSRMQAHINGKDRLLADPRTRLSQIFDETSNRLMATIYWNAETHQGLILPSPSDSLANPPVQYRLMGRVKGSAQPMELQRFQSDYNCAATFFQVDHDLAEPARFSLEPVTVLSAQMDRSR